MENFQILGNAIIGIVGSGTWLWMCFVLINL